MAETVTTPRLMAAAKEFNIGKDTLVDFLVGKGFDKDELKPTAKLSEEMYRALQAEFQSDKVAKLKSIQIDLPKGTAAEAKKKKDEEDLSFRKEEKKPAKKAEPAPAPAPVPVAEVPAPEPVQEAPAPEVTPPSKTKAKKEEPEVVKKEVPEIEGPKVVDKIDLSAIDSSTRPKKTAKKSKKAEKAEETPVAEPVAETPVVEAATEAPEEEPQIENIRAEKIEGPKILGKIDLPVENDTRPKQDEKRKRKRIPIEKKDGGNVQGFQRGGQGTGQGGGGRIGVQRNDNRGRGGQQQGGGRFGTGPARTGARPTFAKRGEDKQIDEKEIQRKIQETQAKLSGGGGKGKSVKKLRRERRNEAAEAMEGVDDNKLQVTEFISVSELANLMDVSFAEVIGKCMGLGIMVSINQRLDAEVIELVASEFGFDVEFIDMEKQMDMDEE
jgi:translation initiation factor IF-2